MKIIRLVSITKVKFFSLLQKLKKSVIRNISMRFLIKKLINWNVPKEGIIKKCVHRKLPIARKINLLVNRKSPNTIFSIIKIIQENSINPSKIIKNNQKQIKL
jgi:hypothetical protein